jgi:glycosyltransferase involved in cell wall biosynthesis
MTDHPIVSIIIPVYNSYYIEESIKSCIDQSVGMQSIEIILINDGSTDNTKYRLSNLGKQYPFRVIHLNENCGPAAARNKGMESAKGEYISFLDSDDMMDKEKLEKQLTYLKENPETDIIISGIKEVNHDGVLIRELVRTFPKNVDEQVEKIFLDKLHTITSTMLFKKDLLKHTGYMNMRLLNLEDIDFTMKLLNFGKMYYYPESLTIRRVLSSGLSFTVSESTFLESRWLFFETATEIFPFLKNLKEKYWSLNYARLGRILQKQGLGYNAREYHIKSIKHQFNLIGIGGLFLSFFPEAIQKYFSSINWKKS